MTVNEAAAAADSIMLLLPDQTQRQVFEESIKGVMTKGKMLMFAHGFNIHFNQVVPAAEVDVSMIAPKAPGHVMRDLFTQGPGVPALVAVYQDVSGKARDVALAYGKGVGCTRAGVIESTFKEETETDLFGEQTTLCGGVSHLIKGAFETLVEAGYQPEVAYFECMHEMKLIVDLFYQGGLAYMRYSVSDTAEYGDYTRGPRVVSPETKAAMKRILGEIQSGQFAREWILENQAHRAGFLAMRKREAEHPIEEVGGRLRKMMSWIKPPRMEERRGSRANSRRCRGVALCLPTRGGGVYPGLGGLVAGRGRLGGGGAVLPGLLPRPRENRAGCPGRRSEERRVGKE